MQQIRILIVIGALIVAGCATAGQSRKSGGSVTLRFRAIPGSESQTRYFNSSRVLTYSDQQLLKDRVESVDFIVANKVTGLDAAKNAFQMTSSTIEKDGVVPLHDLAFPEKDEEIDYVIRETGEILKAGRFPPHSIFFVPSMPIPDKPVQVGDTWALEHIWRSSREGIPLMLEVVAILKDIVDCENGGTCADVEISGHVKLIVSPTEANARFSSRIWGRMLFGVERGDILWAQTRSREDMVHSGGRVKVSSCMISQATTKKSPKFNAECDPDSETILATPRF